MIGVLSGSLGQTLPALQPPTPAAILGNWPCDVTGWINSAGWVSLQGALCPSVSELRWGFTHALQHNGASKVGPRELPTST